MIRKNRGRCHEKEARRVSAVAESWRNGNYDGTGASDATRSPRQSFVRVAQLSLGFEEFFKRHRPDAIVK